MAIYLISYDNRSPRDYSSLYQLLSQWGAKRLLESLWLADLAGSADSVQMALSNTLGVNDGVFVLEVLRDCNGSARGVNPDGLLLLNQRLGWAMS